MFASDFPLPDLASCEGLSCPIDAGSDARRPILTDNPFALPEMTDGSSFEIDPPSQRQTHPALTAMFILGMTFGLWCSSPSAMAPYAKSGVTTPSKSKGHSPKVPPRGNLVLPTDSIVNIRQQLNEINRALGGTGAAVEGPNDPPRQSSQLPNSGELSKDLEKVQRALEPNADRR